MKTSIEDINSMTKTLEEQHQTLKDSVEILIKDVYGVGLSIMNKIKGLTDEDIDDMEDAELDSLLITTEGDVVDLHSNLEKSEFTGSYLEYRRYILKDICKNVRTLEESENDIKDIVNDKNQLMNEYVDAIMKNASERDEKRMENLNKRLAEAKNDKERARIQKAIDTFTALKDLSYIFKGFDIYNEKETQLIISQFLDSKKSDYLLQKFYTKCKQMRIDPSFYKVYLHLEERFLDGEYDEFNNLFLFFIIRYIAYANAYNTSDKVYALKLITSIQLLFYNKFDRPEAKETFIAAIKKYLDYFKPYTETFKKENHTYKYHPSRLAHEKLLAEQRQIELLKQNELPVFDEGEYEKDGVTYKAWLQGQCKDCGARLRWTTEAGTKDYRVQCINRGCKNRPFIDVYDNEVPDFYEDEAPLLDDYGKEININLNTETTDKTIKIKTDSYYGEMKTSEQEESEV